MRHIQLLPDTLPSHANRTGIIVSAYKPSKGSWVLQVRLDACGIFVTVPLDCVRYL